MASIRDPGGRVGSLAGYIRLGHTESRPRLTLEYIDVLSQYRCIRQ